MFSIYAEGPGEPIGAGGRYDELLSRFGAPMAAAGFGLDLDALAWALRSAGARSSAPEGVVYVGSSDDGRVAALRARGIPTVAVVDHEAALAYARSWRFKAVWSGASLFDLESETASAFDAEGDADRVAGVVARMLESHPRGA
jgi:ATP phosphoribosyltransferase regulatory subunit